MNESQSYDLGWSDGYAEGYACKLADATGVFAPSSLEVPEAVEAVATYLMRKYSKTFGDRPSAIGCARAMFKIAQEPRP